MDEKQLKTIKSIIVQELRLRNNLTLIEYIKKSQMTLEYITTDSWNGERDFYNLLFSLPFEIYTELYPKKEQYEEFILSIIEKIHQDDFEVISAVIFKTKLVQYIDWEALPSENITSLLGKINKEKDFLIQTATGSITQDLKENFTFSKAYTTSETSKKIQSLNDAYKKHHKSLNKTLHALMLENPNKLEDLYQWYNFYSENNMLNNEPRLNYIHSMYSELVKNIENSSYKKKISIDYQPTGWEKVDKTIEKIKENLVRASITEDFQSVGHYGREVLLALAQTIFIREKHKSVDGTEIGENDSKRMLEAYITFTLQKDKKTEKLKFIKSAINFANEMTHKRKTTTLLDAELCYNAVISTIHLISSIHKTITLKEEE